MGISYNEIFLKINSQSTNNGIENEFNANIINPDIKNNLSIFHEWHINDINNLIDIIPCTKYNETYLSVFFLLLILLYSGLNFLQQLIELIKSILIIFIQTY